MQPNDIAVEWTITSPPIPSRRWHRWSVQEAETALTLTDETLDDRLNWPRGSYGALCAGFEKGLTRATGWESDDEEMGPAIRTAAGVFKRGVGFRTPQGTPFSAQHRQGSYAIRIHTEALNFAKLIAPHEFPIIDGHVLRAWPSLPAGARCLAMTLDEQAKTLHSVALILDTWRALGRPKSWVVVSGGLIADVAAFAAYLANCQIRFIPTTLLAMADACLGGKTGVNFAPYGKNQVGAFHFPTIVDVWVDWLSTLPLRQLRAGGFECIKHAFLAGDLALAKAVAGAINHNQLHVLSPLLAPIIQVKANIVAEDPGEAGKRAVLNFGHTLAHALETLSQEQTSGEATILHGEAVGIGMLYALLLSRDVAGLPRSSADGMLDTLWASNALLSTHELAHCLAASSLDGDVIFDQIWARAIHDKKNLARHAAINFVLLKGPGQVAQDAQGEWTLPVTREVARKAWVELLARLT